MTPAHPDLAAAVRYLRSLCSGGVVSAQLHVTQFGVWLDTYASGGKVGSVVIDTIENGDVVELSGNAPRKETTT